MGEWKVMVCIGEDMRKSVGGKRSTPGTASIAELALADSRWTVLPSPGKWEVNLRISRQKL